MAGQSGQAAFQITGTIERKKEKRWLFRVRHQRREDLVGLVPGFDCCCLSIDVVRRRFAAM